MLAGAPVFFPPPRTRTCPDEFRIGRSPENDVVLSGQAAVSANHCVLRRINGEAYIEDSSSNGTFVDDVRLTRGVPSRLRAGSHVALLPRAVEVNRFEFIFRLSTTAEVNAFTLKYDRDANMLGEGAFAQVFACIERSTGMRYAVKCINKSRFTTLHPGNPDKILDEVAIIKALRHPNIISVVDVFDLPAELLIVLEYVSGGDLLTRTLDAGSFPEAAAKFIVAQILEAVRYLHANSVAHRDLKPENILLLRPDSLVIKVTDFGLSRFISKESFMQTVCGTLEYIAPEVLTSSSRDGYDSQVDLWSVGVIVYILLSGRMPFSGQEAIRAGLFTFHSPFFDNVSDSAKDFIRKLLDVDPARRLTAAAALAHPWLADALPCESDAAPMSLALSFIGSTTTQSSPAASAAPAPEPQHRLNASPSHSDPDRASPAAESTRPIRWEQLIVEAVLADANPHGTSADELLGLIGERDPRARRRGDAATVLLHATKLVREGALVEAKRGRFMVRSARRSNK